MRQAFISKLLNSDDWVNEEAYKQILKTLEELTRGPKTLDMLISNFVYEKTGCFQKKKSCSTDIVFR
mgnify:CR=1 FL=1